MTKLRLKYINTVLPLFIAVRLLLFAWVGIGIAARIFKFEHLSSYISWDNTQSLMSMLFLVEAFYWNLRYRQLKEQTK